MRTKYKDVTEFIEHRFDTLVEDFIDIHSDEWDKFCEDRYQSALEQDFIDADALYEEMRDEVSDKDDTRN